MGAFHPLTGISEPAEFNGTLEQIGYHDGADSGELLGGSGETYKAVFLFWVSNNDFSNGETARLTWGDYRVDFSMADIREVGSPLDMVSELQNR